MTKLNRHYLFLLIVFVLFMPLLLWLALESPGIWQNDFASHWRWKYEANNHNQTDWPEFFKDVYDIFQLKFILILVGLVWVLNLRRNREGLKLTLIIGLLLAIPLGLASGIRFNHFWSVYFLNEHLGNFYPFVLVFVLSAYLLYCALPSPKVGHYQPLDKCQRHYLYLFLGFVIIGPHILKVLGKVFLIVFPIFDFSYVREDEDLGPVPTYWDLLGEWFYPVYRYQLLIMLIIGALVWKSKLKRNPEGKKSLKRLGFLSPFLLLILELLFGGLSSSVRDLASITIGVLVFGILYAGVALCFYPLLPRPEQTSVQPAEVLQPPKQTSPQLNSTPPKLEPQQLASEPDKSSTLTRDYLTLLPAFVLLGPLISLLLTLLVPTKVNGLEADNVDWWGLYFLFTVPALITGLLIWAGKLRRGLRGSINTVLINMLVAGLYGALYRHLMYDDENVFDLILPPFVALPALLLSIFLPRPEKTMTKLKRRYLGLIINAALLGPLWGALVFALLTVATTGPMLLWLAPHHMDVLSKLLLEAYRIGFVPALITGALVWALQLRRNALGIIVTVMLGFIGTGISAYSPGISAYFLGISAYFLGITDCFLCDDPYFVLTLVAGTLSALFFSFLLPRPAAD